VVEYLGRIALDIFYQDKVVIVHDVDGGIEFDVFGDPAPMPRGAVKRLWLCDVAAKVGGKAEEILRKHYSWSAVTASLTPDELEEELQRIDDLQRHGWRVYVVPRALKEKRLLFDEDLEV